MGNLTNLFEKKAKQFLKYVKLRKISLTNLIFNTIQISNEALTRKKHSQHTSKIDKLALFLPKKASN